ncbi:MAG: terminase family protein [Verrucomicrobiota bacterium]
MPFSQQDAFEQLHSQVAAAQFAVQPHPPGSFDLGQLGAQAERHVIGTNHRGWLNPYPMDDPRSFLLEYQLRYYEDRARFKFMLASRQSGKDFASEGEAVQDCKDRPGTDWMVGAPSERQALDSLEQAKLWAAAWELHIADFKTEREGATSQHLLRSAEIIFANKARIRAVPGKPDTVRGRSANVLLTEFDFFERPSATWRVILPSIVNPMRGGEKKVRLVTTPNGAGSAAHKIWTKGDSAKMAWSRHLVTIYHAVLMGLPVDMAQIREALDDAEGWAQEFECEFLDSSHVLLPYEIIAQAESADATEVGDPAFFSTGGGGPVVAGIDFGRTQDPTICWTLQQCGDVWVTREVLALHGVPAPQQQQFLAQRVRRARRVCYDYTGPGIGLGDYLVDDGQGGGFGEWKPAEHKFGRIELCTFTAGLKREMFPRLRRAFEAPVRLRVPISVAVREDLHAMRQIVRHGEYNYSAPRTAEGHSDRCTALALAWRAAGGSPGPVSLESVAFGGRTRNRIGTERGVLV